MQFICDPLDLRFTRQCFYNRSMKSQRPLRRRNFSRWTREPSIVCLVSFLVLGAFSSSASACQAADNQAVPVTLQAAKTKYKEAREAYLIARRLSAQGSVSQSRLRRARLARDLTGLEVSSLSDPAIKSFNGLLRAQVVYRFRKEEWEVAQRLHQKGATSDLAWRRAEAAKEVANLELQALRSSSQVQRQLKQITAAGLRLEVAREEYVTAKRLFAAGSISEAEFREVARRLEQVQEAHRDSKRSFGVRAIPFRT